MYVYTQNMWTIIPTLYDRSETVYRKCFTIVTKKAKNQIIIISIPYYNYSVFAILYIQFPENRISYITIPITDEI